MGQVGEVGAQGERRERVDRLRDEQAAGPELERRELEQAEERRRRQVLDDLAGEDPAEAPVRQRLEVGERVGLLDLEPFAARVGDHVGVGVDAARLDAGLAQQPEELAAATADVEHGRCVAKVVDIGALALADVPGRSAHLRLEGEVVGEGGRGRLRRRPSPAPSRRRAARCGSAAPPARPARAAASSRERPPRSTSSSDPVDHLQDGVVEHPLLVRERLDVPAQERPQEPSSADTRPTPSAPGDARAAGRPTPPRAARPGGGRRAGCRGRRDPFGPPASSSRNRATSSSTSTESGAFAGVSCPAAVIGTF